MVMVLTIIVTSLLCLPLVWWFLILWKYKSTNNIPGPRTLPILGNTLDVGQSPQDLLRSISTFAKEYGGIFRLFVTNELRVIITDPKIAEQIFNSNVHITKSNAYEFFKPWLGIGLLVSTGSKWKSRRKMITPTFHFKILDQFLEVFNSCGNTLVEKLSERVGKDSFDIYPFINLCSLDIICETAMGVKVSVQEGENTEYVEAVKDFLDIFIYRTFSSWARFDLLFRFSPMYNTYKESLKILHNFTNGVIKKRRQEKTQRMRVENNVDDNNIKCRVALLDMLLESEENNVLSDEDIREEIDTFMFEGHDTTTSGIAFAVLALADNPDVQEKVYDEINSVVSDEFSHVTMQNLQDTKYLEMVIKEVQRMYPSVPVIERLLEMDSTIEGYHLPKDVYLTLYIYGMHHNEKNFPDPEKFDPYRFLPENQSLRHNYVYVPFSAGPRNCIGQKFAMLEMKATIIKIVKNFRIIKVPNYEPDLGMDAILKSYNGIRVRLERR